MKQHSWRIVGSCLSGDGCVLIEVEIGVQSYGCQDWLGKNRKLSVRLPTHGSNMSSECSSLHRCVHGSTRALGYDCRHTSMRVRVNACLLQPNS